MANATRAAHFRFTPELWEWLHDRYAESYVRHKLSFSGWVLAHVQASVKRSPAPPVEGD